VVRLGGDFHVGGRLRREGGAQEEKENCSHGGDCSVNRSQ
jgi:hypothetical protein